MASNRDVLLVKAKSTNPSAATNRLTSCSHSHLVNWEICLCSCTMQADRHLVIHACCLLLCPVVAKVCDLAMIQDARLPLVLAVAAANTQEPAQQTSPLSRHLEIQTQAHNDCLSTNCTVAFNTVLGVLSGCWRCDALCGPHGSSMTVEHTCLCASCV